MCPASCQVLKLKIHTPVKYFWFSADTNNDRYALTEKNDAHLIVHSTGIANADFIRWHPDFKAEKMSVLRKTPPGYGDDLDLP